MLVNGRNLCLKCGAEIVNFIKGCPNGCKPWFPKKIGDYEGSPWAPGFRKDLIDFERNSWDSAIDSLAKQNAPERKAIDVEGRKDVDNLFSATRENA